MILTEKNFRDAVHGLFNGKPMLKMDDFPHQDRDISFIGAIKYKLEYWVNDLIDKKFRVLESLVKTSKVEYSVETEIKKYLENNYVVCEESGALIPKNRAVKGETVLEYPQKSASTGLMFPSFVFNEIPWGLGVSEGKPKQLEEVKAIEHTKYYSPKFAPKEKKSTKKK